MPKENLGDAVGSVERESIECWQAVLGSCVWCGQPSLVEHSLKGLGAVCVLPVHKLRSGCHTCNYPLCNPALPNSGTLSPQPRFSTDSSGRQANRTRPQKLKLCTHDIDLHSYCMYMSLMNVPKLNHDSSNFPVGIHVQSVRFFFLFPRLFTANETFRYAHLHYTSIWYTTLLK